MGIWSDHLQGQSLAEDAQLEINRGDQGDPS
jgi:hypothetical protein